MSVTEPSADVVQPDAGQGDEGSGAQPYAEYLNAVPEEVRSDVEPVFKDWNAHVNQQFEKHADYRKQWEPYEQAGIQQHQPDQLSWALQVAQAAQENPQALREWLDQQHGPIAAPAADEPPSEDLSFLDPSQQFEKLLGEKLGPLQQRIEQYEQRWEQQEQQAREQQISQALTSEVERLRVEHAKDLPKDVQENFEDIIERFGAKYAEPGADPRQVVERAWADFQSLAGQLQTAALQQKVDQPAPAESGGTADLTPEKIDSLKAASRIALEQIRAGRAA